MYLMLANLPMGDDTPVALYTVIGAVALVLLVAVAIMGKMDKGGKKKK